ncbi:uncharacterized protein FFB20_12181 [Fusarium fujikuroi]|nr:uncharacterized protein FFB20_12181 [Fusarium fujikuroi]
MHYGQSNSLRDLGI